MDEFKTGRISLRSLQGKNKTQGEFKAACIQYDRLWFSCFTAKTLQVLPLFYMYFVASLMNSFPTHR